MGRPKDSSCRSYRLIYDALSTGTKSFGELWKLTGLHRNTLSARLSHLVSAGLLSNRKSGRKSLYEIIEPMQNERGILRSEGLRWLNYVWKIDRKEARKQKAILRGLIKEQIKNEKLTEELARLMEEHYGEFDRLVELSESQELLEIISNWESIPVPKLWLMLSLNKVLVHLNSHKLICPYCYHYGTIQDPESNEIICGECGSVIGDEIIQPEERFRLILEFLKRSNINVQ